MEIRKKAWPELFDAVLSGKKRFDLRLADFDVNEGDTLVLEEWNPEAKEYTGRKIEKKITYLLRTNELSFWSEADIIKHGFVVLSLE
ncbi:RNA-binding protein [Candidatus Pacearchaeota archaeon CG_4_9_14_0_2_um_filter_39_13]|nr:DUF3850 domain-containing protein [Candidatus Pacearchaeota archaeon]OIO43938.1 MAG: hypothetical protein AUJ64_01430 [Candidatus Pacearchaeota archaeon CG1_02_39_14]PJC44790.1 MAG: RNA-binding protein [Candidatus Pacearchaeota archaeon CG_4_9_14_0_2_um_filter_39_13]